MTTASSGIKICRSDRTITAFIDGHNFNFHSIKAPQCSTLNSRISLYERTKDLQIILNSVRTQTCCLSLKHSSNPHQTHKMRAILSCQPQLLSLLFDNHTKTTSDGTNIFVRCSWRTTLLLNCKKIQNTFFQCKHLILV